MEKELFHYSVSEYTANKVELCNAFAALHFADGLSAKQHDDISHCLSVLNDFLEALHDGKTIVYEPNEN